MSGTAGRSPAPSRRGMSAGTARALEYIIVGLAILALVMIFQPFSVELFTLGAGAIIIVGLLFNLVPFCQPGKTVSGLVKAFVVVVVVFAIVTGLALAAAELYSAYMQS